MTSFNSTSQLNMCELLDKYMQHDIDISKNKHILLSKNETFDSYIRRSMWEKHKQPTWSVNNGDCSIPIVAVIHEQEKLVVSREKIKKLVLDEFNCRQCSSNCEKLLSIFGPAGSMLCAYEHEHSKYTSGMYDVAKDMYFYAIEKEQNFTLSVATDELLTKNKCLYIGKSGKSHEIKTPYWHYSSGCDTIEKIKTKKMKLFNFALKKYWILIHNLIVKLTDNWNQAGKRHATKQKINAIKNICKEITYAEAHFKETFAWILKILSKFSVPFAIMSMNDRIQIVASAIYDGNINYDGNGDESVVHFQYTQMNNTISMLMKKSGSKSEIIKIVKSLVDPTNKCRKKCLDTPSMTQINKAQSILGENFWTRVATTKTMQEYYKDYKGSPRFWQSPFIENNTDKISDAKDGFASLRCEAATKQKICTDTQINVFTIPGLIKLLVSGKNIYIPVDNQHAVLATTSIEKDNLVCKPVKGKKGLMWSFMEGHGFGPYQRTDTKSHVWQKLIAIHYLDVGVYSNYILVTEKSRELPVYIKNNVVLGEWCFSSKVVRHISHVVSKIRDKTKIIVSSKEDYKKNKEYPIIGVGVCCGPNGLLSHGRAIPYCVTDNDNDKHLTVTGKITHFKDEKYDFDATASNISIKKSNYLSKKYCTNCGAPIGKKTPPPKFCGNCGGKL